MIVTKAAETLIYAERAKNINGRKRHYETIFLLAPGTDEKLVTTLLEKCSGIIENMAGSLLRKDDWGKLKLAHELDKHQQARYFYFRYTSGTDAVKEFERALKLDVNVIRFQTVKLSDVLSEAQLEDLRIRAPKEPSTSPTMMKHEEFDDFA
jgi:small subunit ribosomal protein S6